MKTFLHWFRNDLRVADNFGLSQACQADRVLAVYCFDPRQFQQDAFGFPRTGPFRAKFLRESVMDLQRQLKELNIPLFIAFDHPENTIPQLVTRFGIQEVHAQKEWTRDEARVVAAVRERLPGGVYLQEHFDQFLFHPSELPFASLDEVPEVFTRFRKAMEQKSKVRPCLPAPERRAQAQWVEPRVDLPELYHLNTRPVQEDPRSAFPFKGGSMAALERLDAYFWEDQRLRYYKKTRNGLVGTDYSSKFSPWLANGSLSARQVYWEVKRFEKEVISNKDTYWMIFELIWRDYFKYISLKHGNKIFMPGGLQDRTVPAGRSKDLLHRWIEGRTDNDFINANMLELAHTGWMSNRGRQNVASYWSLELQQDWRIGASYFESLLLDYDVHSNWGNWMYNSGVGNDPRNRKFNPDLQASRYDSGWQFRRMWLQPSLFEHERG